jgi:hypothetical protein
VFFAPNNGNIFMSANFFVISEITTAIVVASVIMQNVPIERSLDTQCATQFVKSALWCALWRAGVPVK